MRSPFLSTPASPPSNKFARPSQAFSRRPRLPAYSINAPSQYNNRAPGHPELAGEETRSTAVATEKQKNWVGCGPVISVRVEPELVERLDALAKRTHRPRSAYIRMALWAMLPHLEHMHWDQVAADYEDLAIKDAFEEITLGFMEDALKKDRLKTIRENTPGPAN